MNKLTKEFLDKYDNKNFRFDDIKYRSGASITAYFALEDGFKVLSNGELEWGYVRIHTGVDRADGREYQGTKDAIISPFDFESSRFEDYHGRVYGTLVVLESKKYDFEFRIAHMKPETVLILDELKNNKPIKRNTLIGPAGNYGISAGSHTHTEIKSFDNNSLVLEEILSEKYGKKVLAEYTNTEIISFYKKKEKFKTASIDEITGDWEYQKKKRKAYFVNKFLYRYRDFDGKLKTRYSTQLLFNGL